MTYQERMDRIEKSHTPTKSSHRRLTLLELDDSNEKEEEFDRRKRRSKADR